MNNRISFSSSHMSGEELEFVKEALCSNETGTRGSNIVSFENELKKFTGSSNIILLNNGTSALHLALVLLGVKNNDEVICPTFAPMSTVNPVIYQGAKPLFVDCEEITWCMSPLLLECAIRDRHDIGRRPKAIIVSHAFGNPAKMNEILDVSERYGIPVIEDASVSLGSVYKNKYTGTYGVMGTLSFASNNIITSSSGGALVSECKALIDRAGELNDQLNYTLSNTQHYQAGYNYLMSNICAGLGRAQMKVLEERIKKRREHFNRYITSLSGIPGIEFQREAEGAFSNRCVTCITVDPKRSRGVSADNIRQTLKAENIECYPLYKPMHLQPVFKEATYYGNWVSDILFAQGICLPSGSGLTNEEIDRVVSVVSSSIGAPGRKRV